MTGTRPLLSVAIPLHNEAGNLLGLYQEIKEVLDKMNLPYEVIYVNDASTDDTLTLLRQLKETDDRVRVIEHKANYGEAAGLTSGFIFSRGEIIVTMDGDGQNDPRDIPLLVEKLREGYKAVTGWRMRRQEKFLLRVLPSVVANRIISLVTGLYVHDNGCGLKAYQTDVVKGFIVPHGFHRFLPAVLGVRNDEVAEVRVSDRRRIHGRSHYGLSRTKEVIRELLTFRFMVDDGGKVWFSRFRLLFFVLAGATVSLLCLLVIFPAPFLVMSAALTLGITLLVRVIYKNLARVKAIRGGLVFQREESAGGKVHSAVEATVRQDVSH